jgi:hypothetical protein
VATLVIKMFQKKRKKEATVKYAGKAIAEEKAIVAIK